MVTHVCIHNRVMLDIVFMYIKSMCNNYGYEISTADNLDNLEYPAMVSMAFGGTGQEREYANGYAIIRGVEQLNGNESEVVIGYHRYLSTIHQ